MKEQEDHDCPLRHGGVLCRICDLRTIEKYARDWIDSEPFFDAIDNFPFIILAEKVSTSTKRLSLPSFAAPKASFIAFTNASTLPV